MPSKTASPPQSAREIVLAAFRAAGDAAALTPADVEAWYTEAHGPLAIDASTLRGAMSREAGKVKGLLERDAYGSYRMRSARSETHSPEPTAFEQWEAEPANVPQTWQPGDLMRFRLPGGPVVTVRLTIHQEGPPLDSEGEVNPSPSLSLS